MRGRDGAPSDRREGTLFGVRRPFASRLLVSGLSPAPAAHATQARAATRMRPPPPRARRTAPNAGRPAVPRGAGRFSVVPAFRAVLCGAAVAERWAVVHEGGRGTCTCVCPQSSVSSEPGPPATAEHTVGDALALIPRHAGGTAALAGHRLSQYGGVRCAETTIVASENGRQVRGLVWFGAPPRYWRPLQGCVLTLPRVQGLGLPDRRPRRAVSPVQRPVSTTHPRITTTTHPRITTTSHPRTTTTTHPRTTTTTQPLTTTTTHPAHLHHHQVRSGQVLGPPAPVNVATDLTSPRMCVG